MKKIILILTLILLISCINKEIREREQCFPETVYDPAMVKEIGKEVEQDMKKMMPQCNWEIEAFGNCLKIRSECE